MKQTDISLLLWSFNENIIVFYLRILVNMVIFAPLFVSVC